jgi:hypothetical protein
MPDLATQGLALAIAQNEGFGKSNAKPSRYHNPGDIKAPWSGFPSDGAGITQFPDIQTGQAALNHQASLIANGSKNYNPNMTFDEAARKYTSNGPNAGANWAKTVDPSGKLVTKDTTIQQYKNLVASGALVPPTKLPNPAANDGQPSQEVSPQNETSNSSPVISAGDLADRAATDYIKLDDQTISDASYQQLNPHLIIETGLDAIPWYEDAGLLTGNPRLRSFVTPVVFKMLIRENGVKPLSNPRTEKPIEIQLNASVKSYNKTSKHVFNKTNTRTGMHITMWGQQADMIEAQCSTGVFMNQLGITDFLSTANVGDDLIKLLSQGFAHTVDDVTGDLQIAQKTIQQKTYGGPSSLRVAAQDAFVEFLSLFKSNGTVWFRKDNYTGSLSENDQAGVSAWSPTTGLSSHQGNARNNDVMTRGYVAMQLKESTYLGFFKSLSWTQDANNPFQWHFNFAFQIERTLSVLGYPR